MVAEATKIEYVKTDSVLEALILEAKLIKQFQPPYNTVEKDDKSFNFVIFTKESYPEVKIVRERELRGRGESSGEGGGLTSATIKFSFGPFVNGGQLKEALKIIRKIFPFAMHRDPTPNPSPKERGEKPRAQTLPLGVRHGKGTMPQDSLSSFYEKSQRVDSSGTEGRAEGRGGAVSNRPCFDYQIGLCPGTCIGAISKKDYAKTIRHLKLFFEGKKKVLLKSLEREMKVASKEQKFEEASRLKRQVFALKHIQDVSLLKRSDEKSGVGFATRSLRQRSGRYATAPSSQGEYLDLAGASPSNVAHPTPDFPSFRIEAYDIAHLAGHETVGVMTVVEDGEPKRSDYRKFKIRNINGANDVANLREVLSRRLEHHEWPMPKLIVIDGGMAQRNMAEKYLTELGIMIPVVSVVKDEHHNPREILTGRGSTSAGSEVEPPTVELEREILLANAEAHRFAITYHKNLRRRNFLK